MKKIIYSIYTLIFLTISLTVYGSPEETRHLSTAVFIFIPSFLAAVFVTYLIWRWNNTRRKDSPHKTINRAPVRRPMVAYKRRKVMPNI
jgi:peptidoglycan/LPS O-acetylase OafA/YrhL